MRTAQLLILPIFSMSMIGIIRCSRSSKTRRAGTANNKRRRERDSHQVLSLNRSISRWPRLRSLRTGLIRSRVVKSSRIRIHGINTLKGFHRGGQEASSCWMRARGEACRIHDSSIMGMNRSQRPNQLNIKLRTIPYNFTWPAHQFSKQNTPKVLVRLSSESLFLHSGSYDVVMQKVLWRSVHAMRQYVKTGLQQLAGDAEHAAYEKLCLQQAWHLHSLAR